MMTKEEKAVQIVRTLREKGYKAFFVGGCVRDKLRNVEIKDYDIATNATPEEVRRLFPRTLLVGAKFGVVVVLWGKDQFEVSTFRSDYDYDGRRPGRVVFVDEKEDVFRRDFTINGLLYDPLEGKLYDYVGGKEDLEKRIVRAIGDPRARFEEDHLRMIRAIRFSSQLGFSIEPNTWEAILELAPKIVQISRERIREEVEKILKSPHPAKGVKLLFESQLFFHIVPELKEVYDSSSLGFLEEVLERLHSEMDWEVGLAAIFFPFPPKKASKIAHSRLRTSNKSAKCVETLLKEFSEAALLSTFPLWRVKQFFQRRWCDQVLDFLALFAPDLAKEWREYRESAPEGAWTAPRLLTGHDLLHLGYPKGKILAQILGELEKEVLEGKIKSKEEALSWLKFHFPL